jgi:DNA-binding response OmpR family regulator
VSAAFLLLRITPESCDQITRVYASRLQRKLVELTAGAVRIKCRWGWGYELAAEPLAVAA